MTWEHLRWTQMTNENMVRFEFIFLHVIKKQQLQQDICVNVLLSYNQSFTHIEAMKNNKTFSIHIILTNF